MTIDCTGGKEIAQSFLVNVTTGAGYGSGTTANVFCIVSGK